MEALWDRNGNCKGKVYNWRDLMTSEGVMSAGLSLKLCNSKMLQSKNGLGILLLDPEHSFSSICGTIVVRFSFHLRKSMTLYPSNQVAQHGTKQFLSISAMFYT